MSVPFKIGDKIAIAKHISTRSDLWDAEGEVVSININTGSISVVLPNHGLSGYPSNFEWVFGADEAKDRIGVIGATKSPTTNKSPQEKPCKVCSKPNDVGVSSCWMCGNAPF